MGVRDRSAKSTQPFEQQALERLAASSASTSEPRPSAIGSDRPRRELAGPEYRPTCKLRSDELLGLVNESMLPTPDELLVVDQDDRRTQEMSAKHFQLLARLPQGNLALSAEDIIRMAEDEVEALLLLDVQAAAAAAPASASVVPAPVVEPVREPVIEPVTEPVSAPVPAPVIDRSTDHHAPARIGRAPRALLFGVGFAVLAIATTCTIYVLV